MLDRFNENNEALSLVNEINARKTKIINKHFLSLGIFFATFLPRITELMPNNAYLYLASYASTIAAACFVNYDLRKNLLRLKDHFFKAKKNIDPQIHYSLQPLENAFRNMEFDRPSLLTEKDLSLSLDDKRRYATKMVSALLIFPAPIYSIVTFLFASGNIDLYDSAEDINKGILNSLESLYEDQTIIIEEGLNL